MDMHNGSHTDAEKSQAGTNLVIVLLVLVIVVAGVKLLMSSDEAIAPTEETVAEVVSTSTATAVAEVDAEEMSVVPAVVMPKPAMPTGAVVAPVMPMGKGEAAFSVLSKDAVAVRAIYVHNPARASEGDAAWVQVYDGYRAVPAGQSTLVFTVSLSAMTYDQVKVRTLNVSTGIHDEVVKMMPVTVSAGEKTLVTIEL